LVSYNDFVCQTLLSTGENIISFDIMVETIRLTGKDIPSLYKEASEDGLAKNGKPGADMC